MVLSSNTVPVTAGQPMSTDRTRNETSERWREETSVRSRVRANQVNVKLEPIYICKNCPHVGEPREGQRAHHSTPPLVSKRTIFNSSRLGVWANVPDAQI